MCQNNNNNAGGGVKENGWNFWGKIYENPSLRQQNEKRAQNGPTMSELLRSGQLCHGELLFTNVPRIGNNQQSLVRQLINSQLQRAVSILDITIINWRWKVRFYRAEDAEEVQRKLDGLRYRNRAIMVRAADDFDGGPQRQRNGPQLGFGPPRGSGGQSSSMTVKESPSTSAIITPANYPFGPPVRGEIIDPSFTPIEMEQIEKFKEDVVKVLESQQNGVLVDQLVTELRKHNYAYFITAALKEWPLGLLRMCQEVRLIGPYASLRVHDLHRRYLAKFVQEGVSIMTKCDWEPMPPCNIRTESHMKAYVTELLTAFGPQHCKVDIPIRLLSRTLPGQWPDGSVALCQMIESLGPEFLLFHDILYLSTNVRHRMALCDCLVPSKQFAPNEQPRF
ncbi:unnamed protein product, partial [Mesorhabditis belari]|uniref:Uncharacterized protein n=1 Tax=Mesorhabditis belari TaxID=2138241 RepID=A0AAF3J5P4_9BILA